jgi:hypothetical protein
MSVRYESPAPIEALRDYVRPYSGGGGGRGGGGGNASQMAALNQAQYEFDATMGAQQQAMEDREFRRQEDMQNRLGAVQRAIDAGALDPATGTDLMLELQTGIDPARRRLTRLQADQEALENLQLSPQEQQHFQQLQGALTRITEQERNGAYTAEQAAAQRAFLAPQLAQYGARQSRARQVGQQVERGLMVQQAQDRIIQRNPDGTMLVVNQHGVPEVQGEGRLETYGRMYQQVLQGMTTRGLNGEERLPSHEEVMARIQAIENSFAARNQSGPQITNNGLGGSVDARSAPTTQAPQAARTPPGMGTGFGEGRGAFGMAPQPNEAVLKQLVESGSRNGSGENWRDEVFQRAMTNPAIARSDVPPLERQDIDPSQGRTLQRFTELRQIAAARAGSPEEARRVMDAAEQARVIYETYGSVQRMPAAVAREFRALVTTVDEVASRPRRAQPAPQAPAGRVADFNPRADFAGTL